VVPVPAEDELLARLRGLLTGDDPVPPEVVAAAEDSHSWYAIDEELARLVADSLLATDAVRGDSARLLTYRAGARTVEIEVSESAGRLRILGQLLPPAQARVRAEQPGTGVEVAAGPLGRFTIENLPPGPTRFVCAPAANPPVCTEWTVL
jgi:hypothetical protein